MKTKLLVESCLNKFFWHFKSLVFLRRYIKFRGISQETYYNVARVMHQLSLFDLAVHFYNKCLTTACFFPSQEEVYSLKRFAAYNLVSIYKHSGSYVLARQVTREYLTVWAYLEIFFVKLLKCNNDPKFIIFIKI